MLTAYEIVLSRPYVYWGMDTPTKEHVNSEIAKELLLEHCQNINISYFFDWQLISYTANSISQYEMTKDNAATLFFNVHFAHGRGPNGMRFEFFLYVLAKDIVVWVNECLIPIKGLFDDQLNFFIEGNFTDKVCICYRLNHV
jgi:hypothetical protein